MDHFKSRLARKGDMDRRTIGIMLTNEQWEVIEREARERELSWSYIATHVLRAWCKAKIDERVAHEVAELVKADLLKVAKEKGQ